MFRGEPRRVRFFLFLVRGDFGRAWGHLGCWPSVAVATVGEGSDLLIAR